ncbi:MAG: hypothetical protein FWD27_08455, partial [Coriobacteriia bacterium]|nr:hypothetical protein [Coriobacteriia bacterium]
MGQKKEETTIVRKQKSSSISRALRIALALLLAVTLTPATALPAFADEVDVAEAEAAELEHGNAAESSGTDSEPVGREQNPVVEEEPQPGGTQTEEQGTDSDPVGRELTPVVEEEPQPGGSEGTIETLSETVSLGLGLSAKLDPTEAWLHDNDGIRTLVLPMHLSGTVSQTGFLHYEISTGNDSIAFIGDWEDDNYTNQRMLPVLKRSSGSNELSMALLLEFEILPGVEIDNIDFSSFSIVNNGSEAGFSVEYSDTPVSDSNGLTHSIEYLSSWHYVEEIGRSLRVLHGPINHNDEDSIYITNGVWPIEVNVGGVGTASKSGTLSYHLGSSNVEQQEEYRISVRAGDEYKWAYPSVMVSADAVITLDSVEFTPSPITLVGLEGLQDPIGLGNGLTAAFNPNSFYLYPIDEGGYNLYFSFEVEGEPQATGIHAYSVGTGNNVFDADPYNRNLSSSFTVLSDDPDTGYENTVSRTIYCYVQVSSDDTSMTIDLSEFSVGSDGFYPGYRVMADRTQTVQANEMDHRIYGFYGGIWINDESQEGSEEKHLSVSSPINVRISTGNYEDDGENPIIVVVAPRGATIEAEIEVTGTPEVPSGAFTYTLLGEGVAMIDNGSYPANSSNHYVPFSISQDTEVTLEVDFTAYPVTLVGLNDLQGPFGFGNGLTAAFNPNSFHLSEIDDGGYNLYFSFEVEGEPQATGIHAYSIGIGNHEFVADPYNGNLSSSFAVLGDDPDIGFENTVSRTIGCYVQVSSDDSPMIIDLSEFTIQSDGFYLGYRVMADRTDTVRENGMDHRIESFSGGIWIDDESQEGSEERYVQASSPINVRTSTDNNEDDDDNSVIVVVAPRGATIEAEIKVTGTPEVPSGAFTYTLSGVGVGMIDSESYPASSGYHHVPFNISQDTEVTLEVGFSAYPVTLIGLEDLKGPFDLGNGIEAVFDPNSFHVSEHYDGGYYLGFNLLLTGQPMQTGTHLYSFNTGTNVFDSGSDGGQNTYDQFVVLGEDPITGYENNVSSARGFSLRISGNDSPMEIDLSELGLELIEFFPGYRAMADRNDTVTNNGMEHGISGLGGAVWTDDDIVIWIDTPINTYNDEASFDEQESKIVVVVPRIAGAGASIEMTGIPDAQGLFTYTLYGQGISVVTNESCAPYTTGYVGFLLTQDTVVTLGVDFTPTPFEIIGQVQDLDLGNGLWARVDTQRVTASIQSSSGGSDDRWIVSVPVDISGSAQEHAIHQVTLDYSQLSSLLTPTQTYNDYTTEGFGVLQGEIPEWRGEAWRILNFFVDLSGEQPVVLDLSKLELTTTPFEPAWVLRVDSTPVEDGDSNATHWLDDAYHQDYSGYVINQTDYNQWITLVPSSLDGELRLRFAQTPLIGGTSIESGMATYTLLANGDPLNTDEPLTCYISQSNWSDTSWSYLNINSSILASLALGSGVVELQLGAVQFEEFSVTFTGEGSLVPLLNSGLTATVQELDDFNPVYQDADGRIWVYFELNISGTVAEPQVWSFCPSTLASTNANLDFSELDLIFFALVPGEVNDSLVFRVPLIEAKTTVVTLGDIALDGLEVKKGGMHRLSLIPAAEEGVSFHPYFEYNSVIVAGAPSKNSNGFGFAPSVDPDEVDLWFALNGTGYDYCAMEGTYLSLYAYYFGYPELTGLYEYQLTINGDPVGGKQSAQLVANNESAYGGADDLHTLTITEDTTVSISVTPPSDDPEPVYVFSTSANTVSLSSTTPSTTVTITSTKDSVAHDWSVQSSPAWLTATATNNTTLTLSIGGQPPATDQTDTVTIKQNDSDNTVSIEVSYTAPTQQISYTISYSANGGTGTVGSQDVTQGASFTTRANAFTRA